MALALSNDLRRRVVSAIEGGLSCRAAAERFGVSAGRLHVDLTTVRVTGADSALLEITEL